MNSQPLAQTVEADRPRTDGLSAAQRLTLERLGLQYMTDDEPQYEDSQEGDLPTNICGWFELVGNVEKKYNRDTEEWELLGYKGPVGDLHYMNDDTMCWEPIDEEEEGKFEAYRLLNPAELQTKLANATPRT